MDEIYKTISEFYENEFIEKRSRFIYSVVPVTSANEAIEYINKRKKQFYDAKHTVFAYILRDGSLKYSDDGEPQGTAGMPILEVIKRTGFVDVCVSVTRYFGGILLGAGGLTRAYANGATLALKEAKAVYMVPGTIISFCIDYSNLSSVERIINQFDGNIIDKQFANNIEIKMSIPNENLENFKNSLTEFSNGKIIIDILGPMYSKRLT